jgi:hypothetical protein
MAGTYIEGSSKTLSGVYTLIQAIVTAVTRGQRGIVAYPFTADWGPVNELNPVALGSDFRVTYHPENTGLTASKIFKHAYNGKPQKILAFRMATSAAAKGTVTLNDSAGTPAKSLELETLYPSARALEAVVKDSTTGGKTIQIVEAGVKLMEVTGSTLADLVKKLNLSDYVRVKSYGTNLPANITTASFTGGNNGSTVTATEYTAFLDAIEADGTLNSFSLDGIAYTEENASLITTVTDWVRRVRQEGLYIAFVNGGPSDWDTTIASANTQSAAFNHRGIINVGNGCDGYTAADMAIFVAARVSSVALNRTMTDETVPYAGVNKKLTMGQRITCRDAGTLIFVQNGDYPEIDEGVNTLGAPPDGETLEFKKIRINTAVDQMCKDLEAFGAGYKKTLSNTQEARELYASVVSESYFKGQERLQIIQPKSDPKYGWSYAPDPDYHGKDAVFHPAVDEAYFLAAFTPVDSMEKIYQKFAIKF